MAKKSSKKTASKKASDDAPVEVGAEAAADGAPEVVARTLKAGTLVHLIGSATDMELLDDVRVTYVGVERDEKFIGMLHRSPKNFELNASSVEGVWNPVTCRREE